MKKNHQRYGPFQNPKELEKFRQQKNRTDMPSIHFPSDLSNMMKANYNFPK